MLSPEQIKKLEKLAKVLDGGDVALLQELDTLEERLAAVEQQVPELRQAKDGEDGADGQDYVLTDKDKKEIAKLIDIPVVEKVIEKVERIVEKTPKQIIREIETVREVPIVTNEIKEVAVLDEATIAYLEDKIDSVAKTTVKANSKYSDGIGLVVRELRAGTGVTIDNSNQEYPVISSTEGISTWSYYATTWSVEPTLNSSITGGDVYNYTLNGTTRYRFVPTTYDSTQDAFYSTFSAGVLSDIIVTRG